VPLWRFGLFCPGHGELLRDLSQRAHHVFHVGRTRVRNPFGVIATAICAMPREQLLSLWALPLVSREVLYQL
jgi:hypothetical protein